MHYACQCDIETDEGSWGSGGEKIAAVVPLWLYISVCMKMPIYKCMAVFVTIFVCFSGLFCYKHVKKNVSGKEVKKDHL